MPNSRGPGSGRHPGFHAHHRSAGTEVPEPSIHPDGAVARFVSILLEEFADEWGNKWMFHMRWAREIDQVAVSRRFARQRRRGSDRRSRPRPSAERMVPRVWFVGSNEVTAPQIEQSFKDTLGFLDDHLAARPVSVRRPAGNGGLRTVGADLRSRPRSPPPAPWCARRRTSTPGSSACWTLRASAISKTGRGSKPPWRRLLRDQVSRPCSCRGAQPMPRPSHPAPTTSTSP